MITSNFINTIRSMKHSPIDNYAGIPGLTSWLIGAGIKANHGGTRLFACDRTHQESIVPHSHRYDLHCIVLFGSVANITWKHCVATQGDRFMKSVLACSGMGHYKTADEGTGFYRPERKEYKEGDEYLIDHKEIHSIFFSRGTEVLVFESAPRSNQSFILEPHVNDETIRTFQVQPWAFQPRKEDK